MGFAVATGHRLTTEAAEQILRAGGTAIDACIAAACTAFVAEPVLAQPLGGGFLMLAPESGGAHLLDAFVQTPRNKAPEEDLDLKTITVDFGATTQDFHIGAGTTAAPCLIPALFELHERGGRVPMPDLVAQAVALAREGAVITPFQAEVAGLVAPILTDDPAIAAIYALGGTVLSAGQTVRNPDLGDVLEVMAIEGPRFFTQGEVAQRLVAMPGSQLTAEDLGRARPVWRTPLEITRLGVDIALNPPPSLGGVQIALALSTLPPAPSAGTVAAAMGQINRIRADLALDSAPESAARALEPDLLAHLTRSLAHRPATRGTTHISVVSDDGTGASLTLSNGEGCGRLVPGTGITPNNMLGEEDLVPGGPNAWMPDRRLASMMCPMALRDRSGTLTMLGSGGSNRIRSALVTTALALIDSGLGLAEAVAAPRLHMEGADDLAFEDLDDPARREQLLAEYPRAKTWDKPAMFFGGVHIARRTHAGSHSAAADPRREGCAATG